MLHARARSFDTMRRPGIGMVRQRLRRAARPRHYTNSHTTLASTARGTANRFRTAQYSAVFPLVALGGLAFSRKSTTWCHSVLQHHHHQQQQQHLQATSSSQQHSVADLILPSLQALLRALRLLQTTGLIVMDYEFYKWQKKATKFVNDCTEDLPWMSTPSIFSSSDVSQEPVDIDKASRKEQQQYWEEEVKRRHDIFEKAQMAYATPSGTKLNTEEEQNSNTQQQKPPPGISYDEWKRQQKNDMKEAAAAWVQAEEKLQNMGGSHISQIHQHAAQRLVKLCRTNAGVYIKIGQHLANLDYIVPQEYIDGLSCLLDNAPQSSYDNVCQVVQEDLGAMPNDLFHNFDPEPIASASLAQVHVAYDKVTGQKLAVKVQHKGLRETCRGDLLALTTVVHTLEFFLEDFNFGWIADEIAPQLPLELDFQNEGRNSEKAAAYLAHRRHDDVVIPKVMWDHTTTRVLCMKFEEGFRATNVDAIREAGMQPRDVAQLISRVFHSQTFLDAYVHCDPHPANVLLRKSPLTGKPQMVLVDHGLYKQLDNDFRIVYAELWKALMMADIPGIQKSCSALGVDGKLYTLLSGLLTARPFDEVIERSKTGSFDNKKAASSSRDKEGEHNQQDKAVIRGYAQKFLVDILTMIDKLPRQMVLLLKMNDCLRHIDYALGSPTNTLVIAGKVAAQAVYEHNTEVANNLSRWKRLSAWLDYARVLWRIQLYEWGSWWMECRN